MKTQFKNITFPLVLVIAIIAINIFAFYTTFCSVDIVQSRDIYGESYISETDSIENRDKLIGKLSGDYTVDKANLEKRKDKLFDYSIAAEYVLNGSTQYFFYWNHIQADKRREYAEKLFKECIAEYSSDSNGLIESLRIEMSDIDKVIALIEYIEGYDEYVSDIAGHSEYLSDIAIYSEDSFIVRNIVKTQRDFYGLSGITLTPVVGDGFLMCMNYRITDFFAILVAVLSLLTLRNTGKMRRGKLLMPVIITVVGAAFMYISDFVMADMFIGLPDMSALIQSVESFESCPYVVSAFSVAVMTVASKLFGCILVMLIGAMVMSLEGKKRIIALSAIIAVLAVSVMLSVIEGAPVFLSEINILSFFSFERFFIRYLNLDIFGLAVSRLPVFIIFAAVLIVICAAVSVKLISAREKNLVREAEQHYYDEINRRYIESRKIRHDINNHLLAINALIERGNIEQAKRYITEVSEQTDLAAMPIRTGSDVLDALLLKKTEQAEEKGVKLRFEVNCPITESAVSDYDFCTIFGNIIDNALEATSSGDTVNLNIGNQHDMLYISCENPYSGELRQKGDRLLTTKTDFTSHGYGILRVREAAERYGGNVIITAEDGKFLIEVLLNKKHRKK